MELEHKARQAEESRREKSEEIRSDRRKRPSADRESRDSKKRERSRDRKDRGDSERKRNHREDTKRDERRSKDREGSKNVPAVKIKVEPEDKPAVVDEKRISSKLAEVKEVLAKVADDRREPKVVAPYEEGVNYNFYDPEIHWCRVCNVFPRTVKAFLLHLQEESHLAKLAVSSVFAFFINLLGQKLQTFCTSYCPNGIESIA